MILENETDQELPNSLYNVDEAMLVQMMQKSFIFFYIVLISSVSIYIHIMTRMLNQRADGIEELIKMNGGVSPTSMGIAYFICSLPPALTFSLGWTIVMEMGKRPIIEYTSGIYIFIGLLLYAVFLVAFGMASSYVINNSHFGIEAAVFIYVATFMVDKFFIEFPPRNWLLKLSTGMLWHMPVSWILSEIFIFEAYKKPLTISDLNSKLNAKGSVLEAYICLILQSVIYFALTWYLSYVRQGNFGNSLPWNFPCRRKDDSKIIAAYGAVSEERDNRYFEEPPRGKEVGIKIMNVSKYYPKPALIDVTMDVYKGEITVLLGHNSAGKTTLMSIINGMTCASEGKVLVHGLDTSSNSQQVRRLIGHCPQHNIFLDDLNVIEHVMFFNMLKGKSEDPRASSEELLNKLGIGDKESTMPDKLSGGMKRRLQLACALAGGSDVLVLDEPTSGLDVETRRELWNLLLSLRGEHTVLLSTHFMEEADALGDRVAALHSGRLRCHATPMYLKRAMGGGYRLSFLTNGKSKEAQITALVMQHVTGATIKTALMNSITYNLPSAQSPQFPALFTALERNRNALEINSIGVGVSTMEEVFLLLCSDTETLIKEETDTDVPASEYGKIKGKVLCMRQAIVLFKRYLDFLTQSFTTILVLHIMVPAVIIFIFAISCNNVSESPEPRILTDPLPDRRVLHFTYRSAAPEASSLLSNMAAQLLMDARRAVTAYSHAMGGTPYKEAPPPNGAKSSEFCVFWAVLVSCAILLTCDNLLELPMREEESVARHLHIMAGCPAALLWLTTLVFHIAGTLLTVVPITIICAYVCDTDNTFRDTRFLFILGTIVLLGNITFFGLIYLLILLCGERCRLFAVIVVILTISFSAWMSVSKMFANILSTQMTLIERMGVALANLLPPFHMIMSVARAAYIARLNALCDVHKKRCPKISLEDNGFDEDKCCAGESTAYISFGDFSPVIHMLIMLVQVIVFMTLVIFVQMGYWSCFWDRFFNKKFKPEPTIHADELVAAEASLVDHEIELPEQQIINHNTAMLVSQLHKNFLSILHKHHVVKGISFSVKKGECFGLLGLNGAGKTTTFQMMISQICPTSGRIFANGVFLHKQKEEFLRKMGYCPQFLGIDEFQSGRDNLRTLLTIRGLDDNDIHKELEAWIALIGLQKFVDMRASSYSGGYKRRLAAAVALSSGAPLSLLDEPTAGVDVGARRRVHAALRRALTLGGSIVITSHSMDEMEALCTRIAIMVAGTIRAIGTSQELRTKYGHGYSLIMKLKRSEDGDRGVTSVVDIIKDAVAANFDSVLKDEHSTMLHYHVNDKMHYSIIFSKLEALQEQFPDVIEDYSVNETTLEEVFLHFAKEHLTEQAEVP